MGKLVSVLFLPRISVMLWESSIDHCQSTHFPRDQVEAPPLLRSEPTHWPLSPLWPAWARPCNNHQQTLSWWSENLGHETNISTNSINRLSSLSLKCGGVGKNLEPWDAVYLSKTTSAHLVNHPSNSCKSIWEARIRDKTHNVHVSKHDLKLYGCFTNQWSIEFTPWVSSSFVCDWRWRCDVNSQDSGPGSH